jgi:C4-dicarboxylate-specific signal transduction histidine kinase
MTLPTPFSALARAVARGERPSDLLRQLHERVLAETGGTRSVILQQSGASAEFRGTSGHGFDDLGGPWLDAGESLALDQPQAPEMPRIIPLAALPVLRGRLMADDALVVPLSGTGPKAFLIVAYPATPGPDAVSRAARAQVEFALALELVRLGDEAALHRRIQELPLRFSRGISSTLSVAAALESLSVETNALFGARRSSVWLHNRRARELALAASSEPGLAAASPNVATVSDATPARGLRLERPQIESDGWQRVLIAPLRGWRRALGTLVIEGAGDGLDDQQLIDAAYDLTRQLSIALENIQLLEEVLQHRRLLEDTFNSLIDLVVVTDNALRVVQMNEAFAARVGTPRAGLLDRPLEGLIGGEMAAWTAAPPPIDRTPEGRFVRGTFQTTARTKQFTDERLNGIFAATVTPLINQDGEPVGRVLVARDITAQTRLESEREALRERLGQSEKLASLGQFVAGIAHEINNPLQGVLGHLELLIETSDAARPVRPTLRRIYQEGDRAARIVRNLLVFTGSRRMSTQRVRIDRVLSRALASRSAARRRGHIEVSRHLADEVPDVAGDPLLLQQAILNILINAEHAITATSGPGRIETSVAASRDNGMVQVTIRDTGSGIPPEILPRIFDPFFTTKEVGQGTGLGLAITYGIVQEHGGTIQAANVPEGGASFVIELPVAAKELGSGKRRKSTPTEDRAKA